ncbi:AAA family ATPase [Kitasatospora camelliae]|uniref:AAA family ATPase n=1 Tax=Kitasatospora camelliae TaxID=3156397 RepID=A0AAU8JZA7_9ACTN
MYVSRIRVSGLRCFAGPRAADLALDPAPGWTVLAGPNGSGKTTLLHAAAVALGAASPPPDAASWLAPDVADGTAATEATAEVDGSRWHPAAGTRTGPPRPCTYLGAAGHPRTPAPLPAEILADGLLPEGWRVSDAAAHAVATGGLEVPVDQLGAGIARLARIAAELAAHPFGTALIDDVDLHLHPVRQQSVGGWLTRHFPAVQFLVAAHSPYTCQAADPGALVRMTAPGVPEPPRVLDEEVRQRVLYGSGDDTALSELFGLPSAYSAAAEAERGLLVRLERKLYAGQASTEELAEYRELGAKLNSSLSARADEVAGRVLGREP